MRILRGVLAGPTGNVAENDGHCMVTIDSWPAGIYVRLDSKMLKAQSPCYPQCGRDDGRLVDMLVRADDVPATIHVFRREWGRAFESTNVRAS